MARLLASSCVLLVAAIGWLRADELRVNDIRLSYTYVPDSGEHMAGKVTQETSDGSVDFDGTLDVTGKDTARHRGALGYYRSLRALQAGRGSLLLGVDVVHDREDEDDI